MNTWNRAMEIYLNRFRKKLITKEPCNYLFLNTNGVRFQDSKEWGNYFKRITERELGFGTKVKSLRCLYVTAYKEKNLPTEDQDLIAEAMRHSSKEANKTYNLATLGMRRAALMSRI